MHVRWAAKSSSVRNPPPARTRATTAAPSAPSCSTSVPARTIVGEAVGEHRVDDDVADRDRACRPGRRAGRAPGRRRSRRRPGRRRRRASGAPRTRRGRARSPAAASSPSDRVPNSREPRPRAAAARRARSPTAAPRAGTVSSPAAASASSSSPRGSSPEPSSADRVAARARRGSGSRRHPARTAAARRRTARGRPPTAASIALAPSASSSAPAAVARGSEVAMPAVTRRGYSTVRRIGEKSMLYSGLASSTSQEGTDDAVRPVQRRRSHHRATQRVGRSTAGRATRRRVRTWSRTTIASSGSTRAAGARRWVSTPSPARSARSSRWTRCATPT